MKLQLILERGTGCLWGRVSYGKELIVDSAITIQALEKKLRKVLNDFHELENVEFDYAYDLTVFFEKFNFLTFGHDVIGSSLGYYDLIVKKILAFAQR